jgi:hypothetical protein
MAQRKPWDSLSLSYRERLSRKGISPQMHAAGESIRAARGHERTPEHPREGVENPRKYQDWFNNRAQLVRRVNQKKEQFFGSSHKWGRNAKRYTNKGVPGGNAPGIDKLQWALNANEEEWLEAINSGDDDYAFLYYH